MADVQLCLYCGEEPAVAKSEEHYKPICAKCLAEIEEDEDFHEEDFYYE